MRVCVNLPVTDDYRGKRGFLAGPLLMVFARGGGGDRRGLRLGPAALCSKKTALRENRAADQERDRLPRQIQAWESPPQQSGATGQAQHAVASTSVSSSYCSLARLKDVRSCGDWTGRSAISPGSALAPKVGCGVALRICATILRVSKSRRQTRGRNGNLRYIDRG